MRKSRFGCSSCAAIALLLTAGLARSDIVDEAFDESFALVVGIDQYDSPAWANLNYAVKDAKAIASTLR